LSGNGAEQVSAAYPGTGLSGSVKKSRHQAGSAKPCLKGGFVSQRATGTRYKNPLREKMLRPGEVAEILNVDVKTVYAMKNRGDVPYHKLGGSIRFDSADISDYIFFSKFGKAGFDFNPKDIKELFYRIDAQFEHTKKFIEKLLLGKGAPMKK
jgi:excisionase family DNA binding protein